MRGGFEDISSRLAFAGHVTNGICVTTWYFRVISSKSRGKANVDTATRKAKFAGVGSGKGKPSEQNRSVYSCPKNRAYCSGYFSFSKALIFLVSAFE
jgi:hypothetical protein